MLQIKGAPAPFAVGTTSGYECILAGFSKHLIFLNLLIISRYLAQTLNEAY